MTKPVAAEAVSIVPGVSILGVLGHLNYEPWFALAEYVDNAIQSAAKSHAQIVRHDPGYRLRVDISYERDNGGRIVIGDNAGGIAHQDFARAFKAAEVPPDRSGLSEFGMGMKSASIWFARNWRVVTTSIGDPTEYSIEFDMEAVLRDQVDSLQVTTGPADADTHYTRIELWNLNQFLPGRTLGKVRDHLREIYRGFLRDNRVILTVAGQAMEYKEPTILKAADVRSESNEAISKEPQEWRKQVDFMFGDDIQVRGWAAIRAEGRTSGNGLSLFRRGRVIVGSGESPYRPTRIYGGGNSYRSQRLFGELEITGLPVSHTKDGFQWHGREEDFEEKLRELLDAEPLPLLKQAEHFRARQASKQEQKRIREATENTADVVARELPSALPDVIEGVPHGSQPDGPQDSSDPIADIEREFSFTHQGRTWTLRLTAASRPGEPRWLVRHVEVEPPSGNVTAHVVLNTAHPFLKQFALGSTDAIEAVFRVAVAMVVSESILNSAGDGEVAGTFMRQIETLLSGSLQAIEERCMTDATLSPQATSGSGVVPIVGDTFAGFLEEVVRPEARRAVSSSAVDVLRGALSAGPASTGLVVGRVQSGKTLSYEGVISLARDNGFAVVVVISGISNPLLAQGQRRLKKDLAAASPAGWTFLDPADNLQGPDHVERELARVKANWLDPATPPAYKETAVVVVLKNYNRIRDLADAMDRVDLAGVRVLVVDDEADQASLNTLVRRGRESSTYANLKALRSALPNHFYLQYTATPQAPLLIAIDDALSPDYVRVLEPGDGYTGGEVYFGGSSPSPLVHVIDAADLQAAGNPSGPPPIGLRIALQQFLVGAAHVVAGGRPETRSMLVHPSRGTADQGTFATWIRDMKTAWHDRIQHAGDVDPAKLRDEFRVAWTDLSSTFADLVDFEGCWNALSFVLNNLDVTEVNTRVGQTPVIHWMPTKFYILVGGQAIDRGFTVEGLTVTYMPRGAGMSMADTIQQRARFFGYKARYLGLCRVFLEPDVRDAFVNYVHHERDMIQSLRGIQNGSDTLKQWRRRFYLDPSMRPTRASVIDIPMARVALADKWITDRSPVRSDALPLQVALETATRILDGANWREDAHGHRRGDISARVALELLEAITAPSALGDESAQALALALARLADDPGNEHAIAVYWMRADQVGRRTETSVGGVQIFQGRSGDYPGDRSVGDDHPGITLQLHAVEVESRDKQPLGRFLVAAWHVPSSAAAGWIIQVGG